MASETQPATGPRHRQNVTDVFLVDFGYGEITSEVFLRQLMIFDDRYDRYDRYDMIDMIDMIVVHWIGNRSILVSNRICSIT